MADPKALESLIDGSAWDDFCDHLKRAGRIVHDAAPDDAFDRAEGMRYVGRIARHALDSFIERSDAADPGMMSLPKLGGDNPDYVYSSAPLSAEFEYRLSGHIGDARYLGIGSYTGDVGTEEGLRLSGYLAADELACDGEGRFEIFVSADEAAGAQHANWLPMTTGTTQLMTRQTLLDRRNDRAAEFAIERIGGDEGGQPLEPARYASQLAKAGAYVEGAIAQFLAWSRNFAQRPNEVRPLDPELASGAQGDPRTHYYGGYYELHPDEALVIDLVPPACDYWNLQLCNHWLESLDFQHHVTHVNDHTAEASPDASVRIVVSLSDPGRPNWLDTAGHLRGGIFLRWVGTDAPCDPACRVVTLDSIRAASAS